MSAHTDIFTAEQVQAYAQWGGSPGAPNATGDYARQILTLWYQVGQAAQAARASTWLGSVQQLDDAVSRVYTTLYGDPNGGDFFGLVGDSSLPGGTDVMPIPDVWKACWDVASVVDTVTGTGATREDRGSGPLPATGFFGILNQTVIDTRKTIGAAVPAVALGSGVVLLLVAAVGFFVFRKDIGL